METRQITQGHIFFIVLNCMYDRCEGRDIVAISDDRQRLIQLYQSNLLPMDERYRDDHGMYRSFKPGLLHDYNPSFNPHEEYIKDDWLSINEIEKAKLNYPFV